jgi:hypothetical protein
MRMPPSWILFGLIVFGGVVAVIGNTLYPLARQQEAKERLAADARTILQPEIDRNRKLADSTQNALRSGIFTFQKWT